MELDLIPPKSPFKKLMKTSKREYVPAEIKKKVRERAKGKCEAKGCNHNRNLQFHHVNMISDDNRIRNIQLLCPNCHADEHKKKKLEVKGYHPITGKKIGTVVKRSKKKKKQTKKKPKGFMGSAFDW